MPLSNNPLMISKEGQKPSAIPAWISPLQQTHKLLFEKNKELMSTIPLNVKNHLTILVNID